jgi:hypothetical protein
MATLTVGAGQAYTTINAAVRAAAAGDTVAVNAGLYVNDWTYINKPLSLVAVGGMVRMQATVQPPNQKAMLITGVTGTSMAISITGFEVWGVKVGDNNGAAVRYEGGNLTLKDVYFHDNQEGLLANAQAQGSVSIDHSEFAHNGYPDGHSHNIYVNNLNSFKLTNSYVHDAIVGHEVKSRAQNNFITNNRIFDNSGSSSYSIDLPNAGNAQITNNKIQQGPNGENPFIIAYGEEGASNVGRTVSIAGNTITNDMIGGRGVLNRSTTALPYTNNSEYHSGTDSGLLAESGTQTLLTRPLIDTTKMAFIIAGTPPVTPPVTPPPVTPPPPTTTMTLAEYHADITKDFFAWVPKVTTAVVSAAIPIYMKEVTSTTVLGIIPGDVWSVPPP